MRGRGGEGACKTQRENSAEKEWRVRIKDLEFEGSIPLRMARIAHGEQLFAATIADEERGKIIEIRRSGMRDKLKYGTRL